MSNLYIWGSREKSRESSTPKEANRLIPRHCAPNKQQIHSSCSVFRGSLRKLSAYLFTGVLELFQKRKCLNFHEMRSNKTQFSRRGSKCTFRIRNWLRTVANKKKRIFELPRRHLLRQNGSRKIYALKHTYQLHSMASTFRMLTTIFHGFQQTATTCLRWN